MLASLIKHLHNQINLIQNPNVDLIDKITLIRSFIENYAIFNFLNLKDTKQRVELFRCFGDFEWYSHQIYYDHPVQERSKAFYKFLKDMQRKYPSAYQKYGRLIKRRLCKWLRTSIRHNPDNANHWQRQLDIINSINPALAQQKRQLLANYMSHHLITKLPFPYRIVFGKSITYFVLKYAPIKKTTYWLLADLSHGTLIENQLNANRLIKIIKKIIQIIEVRLNQK
ncbi:hypothetical protein [Acetilactobacillus jinshanensis]|uniref:Uncharacterized protein n=1 Tax=Acetilactobacillus jinshanensis TaxID=1720083 RepID=A0A4P6ZL48_9LACO|nr:hypothetical protein [Acetilactobacillus jinshanensis]QBP18257.1 hypothetical protein ELX58_03705 [Acetilactobacillus jinshanensis]